MAMLWVSKSLNGMIAMSGVMLLSMPAAAEEGFDHWAFQVTPYIWMAGMGGTIRPMAATPSVEMSNSFRDVLHDLNAAAFVSGLAQRGRLILFGDLTYSSIGADGEVAPGVGATGKLRNTSLTLAGGYRAFDEPGSTVDLLAGMRAWDIKVSARAPAIGINAKSSLSIVDPVLAVRFNKALTPRWSALVYGDVGGFGVDSKSTWQVIGTLNYKLQDSFYVSAGYRYLSLDYRRSGTLIDIHMAGPLLGLTWQF
ncbi:hypothetical protein G7048_03680 [Diaphorobacter sp. HDW4B]|uniref:hypothetical protein n=1 Tax=Diaphorobacter sp. HDW4B TaxID=2714925 RepID=UPI00140829AB|nr:hypothetical protein [Diaphorobacter sp. HDW4B]QIL69551.1 hypothetical protein G7048_03680 [Diaphorobacter sp. HDW4B]